MNCKPVTERHKKVIIIGGGESLTGFDFHRLDKFSGAIISVNYVIRHIPRCDYWITIDMAETWDLIGKNNNCVYYAGCECRHVRKFKGENIHLLERVQYFTDNQQKIIGANSGLAALNLACHFKPEKILMMGVDYCGYGHWYDGESVFFNKLRNENNEKKNANRLFSQSIPIMKQQGTFVGNASPVSAIECFPKLTIDKGLKWMEAQ